jgi:hypothetical protein
MTQVTVLTGVRRRRDCTDLAKLDATPKPRRHPRKSPFDDDQMQSLMREIVSQLYTFHISIDDPDFRERVDRWAKVSDRWDEPDEDIAFFRRLAEED